MRLSKRHICEAKGCKHFAIFKQRLCEAHLLQAFTVAGNSISQRRAIARVQENRAQSEKTKRVLAMRQQQRGPFDGCRDDWQTPGPSGPRTKARAKKMRKPPFA